MLVASHIGSEKIAPPDKKIFFGLEMLVVSCIDSEKSHAGIGVSQLGFRCSWFLISTGTSRIRESYLGLRCLWFLILTARRSDPRIRKSCLGLRC